MKLLGLLCTAICLCLHSIVFSECLNYLEVPANEPVKNLLSDFAEGVRRERNIIPRSKIADFNDDGKLVKVGLYFDSYSHPSLPMARNLILSVVNGLLNYLNADEHVRPLLYTFPFPIENVEVRIEFLSKSDDFTYPKLGNIALVSISDGIISYETLNSYNYRIQHLRSEDYSQAQILDDKR